MKFLKDTAFIIKRINSGEADRFITVFTKEHGKQEFLAKGIRKITSKRSSHLELLNEVKFQAVQTRKHFILTEIEVIKTFSNLKENKKSIGYLFLICELIDKLCPLNQKHEDVFSLIKNSLFSLKSDNKGKIIQDFEIKLLTSLGFWDENISFFDEEDTEQFIEGILERKIKSKSFLKF